MGTILGILSCPLMSLCRWLQDSQWFTNMQVSSSQLEMRLSQHQGGAWWPWLHVQLHKQQALPHHAFDVSYSLGIFNYFHVTVIVAAECFSILYSQTNMVLGQFATTAHTFTITTSHRRVFQPGQQIMAGEKKI